MKERPILFSGQMVRAILEGRKTQTRRIVKGMTDPIDYPSCPGFKCVNYRHRGTFWFGVGESHPNGIENACPYGQRGDRLWVRERWRVGSWSNLQEIAVDYMADNCCRQEWLKCESEELFGRLVEQSITDAVEAGYAERDGIVAWNPGSSPCRKRPSIHMPRWASRITLEITGIRVERLQEISELDAITEGLTALTKDGGRTIKHGIPDRDGLPGNDNYGWHWSEWEKDSRVAYRKLWESINGPGSWDANPWVWVIEFRRINP